MLDIREVIRRLQLGETDRQIARDVQVSRKTVSKYRVWAQQHDVLIAPLPDPATLQAHLKTTLPVSTPPATPSKVTPFRDQVVTLRQRGVECRAIYDILREQHAFAGSYGSVYRFRAPLGAADAGGVRPGRNRTSRGSPSGLRLVDARG